MKLNNLKEILLFFSEHNTLLKVNELFLKNLLTDESK